MKKVLAVLGLAAFEFHSNFWGNGKKHVRLTEEELQKIDDELEKQTSAEDAAQLASLVAQEVEIQESLTAALALNGIEAVEGQTVAQAIEALGAKCKEFGDANPGHTIIPTDGKDKPEDNGKLEQGFFDPNAEHNQID